MRRELLPPPPSSQPTRRGTPPFWRQERRVRPGQVSLVWGHRAIFGPCPTVNSNPVLQPAVRAADLSPGRPRGAGSCEVTWMFVPGSPWTLLQRLEPSPGPGSPKQLSLYSSAHPHPALAPATGLCRYPELVVGVLIGAGRELWEPLGGDGEGGRGRGNGSRGTVGTDPGRSANPKGPPAASPQTGVLPAGRTQPCRSAE